MFKWKGVHLFNRTIVKIRLLRRNQYTTITRTEIGVGHKKEFQQKLKILHHMNTTQHQLKQTNVTFVYKTASHFPITRQKAFPVLVIQLKVCF